MTKKKIETPISDEPILYILMRSDLGSMNPGKAMAQACHAANAMVKDIREAGSKKHFLNQLLVEWEESTSQGFGTTVVLDVFDLHNIDNIVTMLDGQDVSAGIVHDPTYPLKDGKAFHLIPLDTCGWVFARKNNPGTREQLDNFKLFK